jgi:3-oxoacyl-[acyl-carrier-protein] synthase-3
MFDLSKHDLGIERLEFYVPEGFCSVLDYCRSKPQEFTVQNMAGIWKASFFEPEFQHRFFTGSIGSSNGNFSRLAVGEVDEFTRRTGLRGAHCALGETASDMAVKVVKRMLSREPAISNEIRLLIHYYSTLNEQLMSSTPGRLQHEADLKGSFGFSVGQKNSNSSLMALKIAADMLIAEPGLKAALLAGSDKLAPPYERVFGKATIMGDSASALVVRRGGQRRRLLAYNAVDFPEWWNPYEYDGNRVRWLERFVAEESAVLLNETLKAMGLSWQDIALVLPPNMSMSFVQLLGSKAEIPVDKIYTRNISRYGYLMASDLVVNLASASDEGAANRGDIVLMLSVAFGHSVGCLALRI